VIDELLLYRFIVVAALLVIAAIGAIFIHAIWLRRREERRERSNEQASQLLSAALSRGANSLGGDLAGLRALRTRDVIHVFLSVAATLQKDDLTRLRIYAEELGVGRRASRLLRSRSWTNRLHSARLLMLLGTPPPAEVKALFRDRRPELRAQAAEWIGQSPTPELVDLMIGSLGSGEGIAHYAIHDALVRARRVTIERLTEWLGTDHPPDAIREGLEIAARVASPAFLRDALQWSLSDDASVRAAATNLLGAIGGEEAATRLMFLLNDPDPRVRATAVSRLGSLRLTTAAGPAGALLRDPDFEVRRAAAFSLRNLGDIGTLVLRSAAEGDERQAAAVARHVLDLPFSGSVA
jgi:hypothetical protein